MNLLHIAAGYAEAGLSIIAVDTHTKKPFASWKSYQEHIATPAELSRMFAGRNGTTGFAVICGRVSNNLECLDFDNKDGDVDARFNNFISDPRVKAIIEKYSLPYEKSPSGGYHLFLRCIAIAGNLKLAKIGNETVVETRGEGGYVIVSPSHGYSLLSGDLTSIAVIEETERFILMDFCRGIDSVPAELNVRPVIEPAVVVSTDNWTEVKCPRGGRPGDEFANDPKALDIVRTELLKAGWTQGKSRGIYEDWTRPGKTDKSVSATIVNGKGLQVFSTNAAPFDGDKGYSLFHCYTLLAHSGNFKNAAAGLRELGYGKLERETWTVESVSEKGHIEKELFFVSMIKDKLGNSKTSIDYTAYIRFLHIRGFRKFIVGSEFIIVRVDRNLVDIMQLHDIADIINQYVTDNIKSEELLSVIIGLETRLLSMTKLAFLETLPDDFLKDDAHTGWLFFRNIAVRVTKIGAAYIEYAKIPKPIWKSALLDRDLPDFITNESGNIEKLEDDVQGEFRTFILNTVNGNDARFNKVCSVIGYMLHRHKTMSNAKAMILCDEKIPDLDDDANGGTGKSLIAKYLQAYRNGIKIGSKGVDFRDRFMWQDIGLDTDFVLFDDIGQNFPLTLIFDKITGDMRIERKNQAAFTIKFADAPKFILTTNHTVKGTGASYERRKYEVELSPYYNEERSPRSEFGHDMFTEWSNIEQVRADWFAMWCLRIYIASGLVKVDANIGSPRIRQAISETSREFFEFMMDKIEDGTLKSGTEFNRKDLFDSFNEDNEGAEDSKGMMVRSVTFGKWINKFGSSLKLKIKNRKSGKDRYTSYWGELNVILTQYRELTGAK